MTRSHLGVATCVLLIATSVHAESQLATGVRLSFVRADGAADCVTANDLERELTRRMGRDPFAGAARQWVEGFIERRDEYFEVQLFERDAEGKTLGNRRLRERAKDCHTLDDAIVLSIALIIDPDARLAPVEPSSTRVPTVDNDLASAMLVTRPRDAQQSIERESKLNANRHDRVDIASPALPSGTKTKATTSARPGAFTTVDGVLVGGVLPGAAPGAELMTRLPLDEKAQWSLRLSVLYLPEKRQAGPVADLGYGLTAFETGACWSQSKRLVTWYGCSSFGLGSVTAVVHSPAPFEPGDRLWTALRAEAGITLRIIEPLWLETRLFDLFALRRWQFRVRDGDRLPEMAFKQRPFMPGAALGLGLHFD